MYKRQVLFGLLDVVGVDDEHPQGAKIPVEKWSEANTMSAPLAFDRVELSPAFRVTPITGTLEVAAVHVDE